MNGLTIKPQRTLCCCNFALLFNECKNEKKAIKKPSILSISKYEEYITCVLEIYLAHLRCKLTR